MYELFEFVVNSPEAVLAAAGMACIAIISYLKWYRPALEATERDLQVVQKALASAEGDWDQVRIHLRETLKQAPGLALEWLETEQRVVALGSGGRTVMMASPRDIWGVDRVLSRRLNTALADAVPNMLVGAGLLFTFLFLAWALVGSTSTLVEAGAGALETEQAIQDLLSVAGAKFLTSLVGLASSLLWYFQSRRWQYRVQNAVDALLMALAHHVSPHGMEQLIGHQLDHSNEALAYADEVLVELRDQSGVMKRFETDLVLAMKGQTDRMIQAIDVLASSLTSFNGDMIKTMMQEFLGLLQKMTEEEFTRFQEALVDATEALQVSAEQLRGGAAHLTDAAGVIKDGVYEFEQCLDAATLKGARGMELADEWLTRVDDSQNALLGTATIFKEATGRMDALTGGLHEISERVSQVSTDQMAVVENVRALVPKAAHAAEQLGQVMSEAVRSTRSGMEATAKTLGAVVQDITQGISEYSTQVSKLHASMDEHMGSAVESFDKGVNDLSRQVESLRDFSVRQVSDASLNRLVVTLERLIALRARTS